MKDETISRLEVFLDAHKARSCTIHIDDGYGASCWAVDIQTENGPVSATEVGLMKEMGIKDWPGLAPTTNEAVDKAVKEVAE